MAIVLTLFSIMIIGLSLYGVVSPLKLTAFVRGFMAGPGVWGAVLVRVSLAGLFWFSAPISRTPAAFKVLAILTLLAAIVFLIVGSTRLLKLIEHIASWPLIAMRFQCLIGVACGVFLLWSVFPY